MLTFKNKHKNNPAFVQRSLEIASQGLVKQGTHLLPIHHDEFGTRKPDIGMLPIRKCNMRVKSKMALWFVGLFSLLELVYREENCMQFRAF